jgi:hypothetical protein
MAGKPIPVSTANEMKRLYIDYMVKLGVDMDHQTQSVSFTNDAFADWLSTVKPFTDELWVFMGVYPEGHEQAGRTTVILWPYKDGKPASKPLTLGKDGDNEGLPPYNDGAGNP